MFKTKALVINSYLINENDKIVKIFSEKFGILTFYAYGVNKIISKNKFSLELFSLSEFEIFISKRKKMSRLKRGTIIATNLYISLNYDLYLFFNYLTDIIEKNFENYINYSNFFFLIEDFLLLSNDNNWLIGFTFLMYKLLNLVGVNFVLDECSVCKNKKNIITFSFKSYSFICINCVKKNQIIFNTSFLKLLYNWKLIFDFKSAINLLNDQNLDDVFLLLVFLLNYYYDELGIATSAIYEILKSNFFKNIKRHVEHIYLYKEK